MEIKRRFGVITPDAPHDELVTGADILVKVSPNGFVGIAQPGVRIFNHPYFGGLNKTEILVTDQRVSQRIAEDLGVWAIHFEVKPPSQDSVGQTRLRVSDGEKWRTLAVFKDASALEVDSKGRKTQLSSEKRKQAKKILKGLTRLALSAQSHRDKFGQDGA